MTAARTAAPRLDSALRTGLRWLYATAQPPTALVERCGATMLTATHRLRLLPTGAGDTPLIVVDRRRATGAGGILLGALPPHEPPGLTTELATLGIPTAARHYHAVTGTIVLDAPAHRSLRAAVARYEQGCPRHGSARCRAPRAGACGWLAAGRAAAIWPDVAAAQADWR